MSGIMHCVILHSTFMLRVIAPPLSDTQIFDQYVGYSQDFLQKT